MQTNIDLPAAHHLASDHVSLSVTRIGGHLDAVSFVLGDGSVVRPMHAAPWRREALPADTPMMLRQLTGDFFCAPFGPGDVPGHESPVHGRTAGSEWLLTERIDGEVTLTLDQPVMGATVSKTVSLDPAHAVVYQRHVFRGGTGRLPIGHHAMLSAQAPLQLAFGPHIWAGTPPDPTETPPHGRCLLANNRTFDDLTAAPLADGGTADITRYPFAEKHDDIWMVVADPEPPFGWTAATCASEGWVWFSLKDPRCLPQTVVWMSNGGRSYQPWNDRHLRAIGLEDVCGYFHLGHSASLAAGHVPGTDAPTTVSLTPEEPLTVSYMFGIAPTPAGFGPVARIRPVMGGVALIDRDGAEAFAACNTDFLKFEERDP